MFYPALRLAETFVNKSDSKKLSWINGLVCLLEGTFNKNNNEFKSIGYE
jgi:hypothetical protein